MSFDNTPSRDGTFSYKWEKYKAKDVLPCWIADTEFRSPQAITDALARRVDHGVLGYTLPKLYSPANDAVIDWCKRQYSWSVDSSWIVWTPGVVPAFNMACKAFCKPGDAVLIQTPNYPPLLAAPAINGCKTLFVNTIIDNARWQIDFNELEQQASKPECKLFILCNPMNPVGTVLSAGELSKVAAICEKYGVVLCSDEIHCDLILDGQTHIPASSLDSIADNSITLMAASKTFNIAGLGTSFAIIPDPKVRRDFVAAGAGIVPWPNILGLVATQAAYSQCDDWRIEQINYLRQNRDILLNAVDNNPALSCLSPQATFLLWIDASLADTSNTQLWCESRGFGPSPGRDFGCPDFFRINFGCSKSYLLQIIERMNSQI